MRPPRNGGEWFTLTADKPYHLHTGFPLAPKVQVTRQWRTIRMDYLGGTADAGGQRLFRSGIRRTGPQVPYAFYGSSRRTRDHLRHIDIWQVWLRRRLLHVLVASTTDDRRRGLNGFLLSGAWRPGRRKGRARGPAVAVVLRVSEPGGVFSGACSCCRFWQRNRTEFGRHGPFCFQSCRFLSSRVWLSSV